jgi:hypothetical protein
MDPAVNLGEQIELAREIIAVADRDDPRGEQHVAELGERLAELVLALDEWRRRGGFDPYAS